MHLVRTLPLALLALAGAVTADDYDYIRGDDIYSEDYNYGLNYDRLRSVPETPDADLGGAGASPESIGERDGAMGAGDQGRAAADDRQPSMTRRIQELRRETYPDPLNPGLDDDGDARPESGAPPVPGR